MLIGRYERQVVTTGITYRVQIGWWEGGEEEEGMEGGEGGGGELSLGRGREVIRHICPPSLLFTGHCYLAS